ncbi:MAG: hypothetical protein LWX83_15950 [Anaerolineae bacterium]|nr:hypothetical protein [Anaerolineae bacterium]
MAKTKVQESDMILEIEQNLQNVLQPVQPRSDFVSRFGQRLTDYPQVSVEARRSDLMLPAVVLGIILLIPFSWLVWRYLIKPGGKSGQA